MDMFNSQVRGLLKKFEYEFYLIRQDFNKQCLCFNFDTKQASSACPLCLGAGFKIYIKKIRGASSETQIPKVQRPNNDTLIGKIYYLLSDIHIERSNIIIDRNNIYTVNEVQRNSGFNNSDVYNKIIATENKYDNVIKLKNFNNIIK